MKLGYDVPVATDHTAQNVQENLSNYYERCRTYQKVLRAFGRGRRLFVTQARLLGLGPDSAEVGDAIYIIPEASTPFVFRRKRKKQYQIIGECYAHGIMDGEFVQRKPNLADLEIY